MFQRLLDIQAQDLGEIWRTYQLYGEVAEGMGQEQQAAQAGRKAESDRTEFHRLANSCMKKCSMSLTIRDMQIETTNTSPHTCQDGIYQKNPQETTSIGKDLEKREPLCMAGGNIKQCNSCGKQHSRPSKNETWNYQMMQLFYFWANTQKN